MIELEGNLHKMYADAGEPVRYRLELGNQQLELSEQLGRPRLDRGSRSYLSHCRRSPLLFSTDR